ncbi:hypothetical protein QE152_g23708 [Popillia japonica]|uniref:Uncharacterized protein n=1 Tax=Popillia japonica TaxID=7064 RepID=A0AAW1KGR3_POPJA
MKEFFGKEASNNSSHTVDVYEISDIENTAGASNQPLDENLKSSSSEGIPEKETATNRPSRWTWHFSGLLKQTGDRSLKNGKWGLVQSIARFQRDQVLERLPQQNLDETNDRNENVEEGLNNFLVNLLRTMIYGDGQNVKSRRRKIQVSAGKSVTSADFDRMLDKGDQADNDLERRMETLDEDSDPDMHLSLINSIPIMEKAQGHSSDEDSEMDTSLPSFTDKSEHKSVTNNSSASVCFEGKLFRCVSSISLDLIEKGTWLLVCFPTKYRNRQRNKFFIGQVINIAENDIGATEVVPPPNTCQNIFMDFQNFRIFPPFILTRLLERFSQFIMR